MGRIEKLVVLTVLFLAALVIAVNLSGGDEVPEGADTPIESARADLMGRAERASGAERVTGEPSATQAPLLSASLDAPPAAGKPTGAAGAPGEIDRTGLRPSTVPDLWIYDWQAGDTWSGLAARIYGDASYEGVLRSSNEGVARPDPGTPVLVPMIDRNAAIAPAPANAPAAAPAKVAASGGATASGATGATAPGATSAPAAPASGLREHVVRAGDTLSSIAQQYYGSAARWRELANANREVVPNPDRLSVGTKLKVP